MGRPVIPGDFITEWRQTAPWPNDAQVEQDLVLSRALVEIFEHPLLGQELALRGGTALHKLVLPTPLRYSEDIDLVQVAAGPIGPIMSGLRETMESWLGTPRRSQGEGRMTCIFRFDSELPPIVPLRLKIEVNTREHFTVLGHVTKPYAVESRWFAGAATIRSFALEELLATKLRALFQRRKGRDLFDLAIVLQSGRLDATMLIECFEKYMARGGAAVSRAQFEENLMKKLAMADFAADFPQILSRAALSEFEVNAAGELVLSMLIAKLKGEPWQGRV